MRWLFLGFGAIMLLLSIVELAECWRQILRGNSDIVLVLGSYQPSYYWLLILHMHSFLFWTEFYPSFLIGMVFFFQNCSDLLWENSRLKAENLQNREKVSGYRCPDNSSLGNRWSSSQSITALLPVYIFLLS